MTTLTWAEILAHLWYEIFLQLHEMSQAGNIIEVIMQGINT